MNVCIKICGLTTQQAVQAAIDHNGDYAGFVYFPASSRHVSVTQMASLKQLLPSYVNAVSVLVDPDNELLDALEFAVKPDFFQLHGNETPARVCEIKTMFPHVKIIKAISITTKDDIARSVNFIDVIDMLMFDAKPPHSPDMLPGGNGISFDWKLLAEQKFSKPWFLSGGLTAQNIQEAIRQTGAKMVDVSSGVESVPGVKNVYLIEEFIRTIRTG